MAERTSRAKRVLGYGTLVVVVALAATIVSLPASVAGRIAASASNGQVALVNAGGTIWNGRGDLSIALDGRPLAVRGIQWRILWSRLLAGELCATLDFSGDDLRGRAVVAQTFGATALRDVDLALPAEWIAERVPLLAAWGVSGAVAVKAREARFDDASVTAEGEIVVRQASAARLGPLGDYRVTAAPAGAKTAFKIATLAGPLQLSGAGELGAHGDLQLAGAVIADAGSRERLGPFIAMLGPRREDGTVAIQWPVFGPKPAATGPRRGATAPAGAVQSRAPSGADPSRLGSAAHG